MKAEALPLDGMMLVQPQVFQDDRGYFLESYQRERYREHGIDVDFVQDNFSRSIYGTLRGLHYQAGEGQAKLVHVARGRIWDVAVDMRRNSPTFGQWHGVYLDAETHGQVFLPTGFAHGFCVISDHADVVYKVSRPYDGSLERTIRWDDPDLGVEWPMASPRLSMRDRAGASWAEVTAQ